MIGELGEIGQMRSKIKLQEKIEVWCIESFFQGIRL
ncbi:unnamed protein product [Paramecium octaurelia]|uniref:Uncharacterized protein n=1 Tax=Paramecium octaurelia TaxID=43137 RepID=A0A8S1U293_PAROT|nr:unnamed protein product [Paramecium octaurelia]